MDPQKVIELRRLAGLSKSDIGEVEESVKINFIVPFLECFGHRRLEFEYRYKDIIIQKAIHKNCKVIVETKSYEKKLDNELSQLKRYCDEERPLIGMIANGEEVRIYSHFWRRSSFEETLIFSVQRTDLSDEKIIAGLHKVLSQENLESGKAQQYVDERELEIEAAEEKVESLQDEIDLREGSASQKVIELEVNIESIRAQIDRLKEDIMSERKKNEENTIEIWKMLGFRRDTVREGPIIVRRERNKNDLRLGEKNRDSSFYENMIELTIHPSDIKHGIILFSKEQRSFFPGFNETFVLEIDGKDFHVHVTSGKEETKDGDPEEGKYLVGRLKEWYRNHKELKEGDRIMVSQ